MKRKMLTKLISAVCAAALTTSCTAMSVGAIKVADEKQDRAALVQAVNRLNDELGLLYTDISSSYDFLDDDLRKLVSSKYDEDWCNWVVVLLLNLKCVTLNLYEGDVFVNDEALADRMCRQTSKIRENTIIIRQLMAQLKDDLTLTSKQKDSPTKTSKRELENINRLISLRNRIGTMNKDILSLVNEINLANKA